jgi:hypothetical protein
MGRDRAHQDLIVVVAAADTPGSMRSYRSMLVERLPLGLVKRIKLIGRVKFTTDVVICFDDGSSITVAEADLLKPETLARIALEAP